MGIPLSQFVILNKSRMRAKYWREDGNGGWVETGMLPADPASQLAYFAKGFKAKPPENGATEDTIKCPLCSFGAKNASGFNVHFKIHLKKEEK